MNMISTGAFQTEMDASNKQPTLAEKFAAVWEKKNAKTARAGGVSLMALSLAACGSDDATTTTATSTTTTSTTTTTTPTAVNSQLTVGVDTLAGGAGADTFSGTAGNSEPTITAGDSLTGGDGSDMVLMVATGANNINIAGVQLDSVETVRVADSSTGGNTTVNLAGQSGITDLESSGSAQTGNINFSNVSAIADLNLSNTSGGGTTTVTYTAAATAGTADVQNIHLSTASQTGDVTIAGVETIAVTSDANSTLALSTSGATKVTLDAGATTTTLDLDATANTSLVTVDASATTGANTITIDADLSADGITVTGGSGADTIDSSAGVLAKTDTIDGGAGTDTLRVQATADTGSATIAVDKATISNMEVLELEADDDSNNGTAADFTVDMDLIDGVTSVVLDSNDTEFASIFNLDDLSAAQAGAISVQGVAGTTNGSTVNLDLKDGTGAADSATITASVKSGNVVQVGDDNGNIESLTVAMNGATDATLTIDTGDFAGDTTADGSITVTGGAAGKTLTVSGSIVSDTLDLSGVASDVTVTMGTVDSKVTGGSGDDIITMAATFDNSDTIDGGDGADILSLTQTAAVGASVSISNVETLKLGGTGTASVNMASVTGVTTVDLDVGAGFTGTQTLLSLSGVTKISIDADDNTAANNDYQALTISNGFTGLADALEITVNSDATNGMNGTEGLITVNGAEDLTISTTGGKAVQMGGVTSNTLKTVTVTADGSFAATDAVTLGTITGGTGTITSFDSSGADVIVNTTVASLGNSATVTLGDGADVFDAGASSGIGIVINGGKGNDQLTGSAQADIQYGGAGDDTIVTGGGTDTVYGDAGNDTITGVDSVVDTFIGGSGNDIFNGNGGNDVLTGGTGSDNFILDIEVDASTDTVTITDFTAAIGGDVLTIHAVTGGTTGVAGGIVADNSGAIVNIAGSANNAFIVDTLGAGHTNVAAFELAVETANANTADFMGLYFDTTDNVVKLIADAASNTVGSSIVLAEFSDITTAAASDLVLDAFVSANLVII
jgi:hypothetical protein